MTKSFDLSGRRVFISGAAGRLGRAIAVGLAAAGAEMILNGRNAEKLDGVVREIRDQGHSALAAPFDISDAVARRAYFDSQDRIDVLINNAYAGKTGTWEAIRAQDFRDAYEIAVVAAFEAIKDAERPLMAGVAANGQASVINMGSMYGAVSPDFRIYGGSGYDSPPSYGAAKAALLQMTRYAAVSLARKGIRVNCISPGPFPPPDIATTLPDFYEHLVNKVPMGRIGQPQELVGPTLFLASDASSYLTGTEIPVDGGWRTW
jgi:NAD(P)-dependent dehydrogenase (short-subunit alcohol dehydrogenase family)